MEIIANKLLQGGNIEQYTLSVEMSHTVLNGALMKHLCIDD